MYYMYFCIQFVIFLLLCNNAAHMGARKNFCRGRGGASPLKDLPHGEKDLDDNHCKNALHMEKMWQKDLT